jgi:molybdopterin converting factor small subunit
MMMNIVVKYLAQARPAAGRAEESVSLHEPACVRDLLHKLADVYGIAMRQLLLTSDGQPHPSLLLIMGDQQIQDFADRELCDDDEIVLLPPMAGG